MLTSSFPSRIKSYTAILQTNRTIYNEAVPILAGFSYRLLFVIHPDHDLFINVFECLSLLVEDLNFYRRAQKYIIQIIVFRKAQIYTSSVNNVEFFTEWTINDPVTAWLGRLDWTCEQMPDEGSQHLEVCHATSGKLIPGVVFAECLYRYLRIPMV